jgi:hypothetical protein
LTKRADGENRIQKSTRKSEESVMFKKAAVDAELIRSLGLTMKELEQILAVGGDLAETKFMECCWRLWKADGIELVEPFIEVAFNILPEKSRSVLFERMLTIVYVAQDSELHAGQSENRTETAPT